MQLPARKFNEVLLQEFVAEKEHLVVLSYDGIVKDEKKPIVQTVYEAVQIPRR